jgi:two-component system CheB/CheR fusion protein
MTRLLEDLLEVSRITQNKIDLRRQTLDARTVIQDAATALRQNFATRKVALEFELPPNPVLLDADPARVQQIVVNLLDNGSKYSRPGGHVRLTLSEEGSMAKLSVKDDGVGMDPSALQNVFEPFVQDRATLHRTEGGMGIGLTVVRSLVQMHGGHVSAHSLGLNQGSEFNAYLPLSRSNEVQPTPVRYVFHSANRQRIVVIEDNTDSCEMLALLLEQAGHEVKTAADGQSGLELIKSERPSLAIVDVGLPVLDGFEVARRVRQDPQLASVCLVALTGYGQASDQAAALAAGFDEHLVKPLDPEQLSALLRD